ncbi:hypothetical protein FXO38_04183 [Capsicum annuum]|nr:hypothetical protein FXO38_04183 [Capsicum annuum]
MCYRRIKIKGQRPRQLSLKLRFYFDGKYRSVLPNVGKKLDSISVRVSWGSVSMAPQSYVVEVQNYIGNDQVIHGALGRLESEVKDEFTRENSALNAENVQQPVRSDNNASTDLITPTKTSDIKIQKNGQEVPCTLNTAPRSPPGDEEDEYRVIESENKHDQHTRSINDENEEGEETSAHLSKAFGSTLDREFQEEIQEVVDKQCLSPRG